MKTFATCTYDECLAYFETKTLRWCIDQFLVLDSNLKYGSVNENFPIALREAVRQKKESGETYPSGKFCGPIVENEDTVRIEHVPFGGKGQTVRVVVPENF